MKTVNYKGKGEHSVRELELIIEQQAEELHLIKSEQFLKTQGDWLMANTSVEVERIVDFVEHFKQ